MEVQLDLELDGRERRAEVPKAFSAPRVQVAPLGPVQAHPAAEGCAGEREPGVLRADPALQGVEEVALLGFPQVVPPCEADDEGAPASVSHCVSGPSHAAPDL